MIDHELAAAVATLECQPGCSFDDVKSSYRQLVKVWHPDRFQGDEKPSYKATDKMKAINEAYYLLERYFQASEKQARPNAQEASSQTTQPQDTGFCRKDQRDESNLPNSAKSLEQIEAERKLAIANLTNRISIEAVHRIARHAKSRGVDVTIDFNWLFSGTAFLPENFGRVKVVINPNKATINSIGSLCDGYAFIHLLRKSPYATDRSLITNYESLVKSSGALEKINAERQKTNLKLKIWDADDYMASQQGFETILRDPAITKEGEWGKWFRDFKGQMQSIVGNASEKEIRRVINYKWQNDQPFERYFGIK